MNGSDNKTQSSEGDSTEQKTIDDQQQFLVKKLDPKELKINQSTSSSANQRDQKNIQFEVMTFNGEQAQRDKLRHSNVRRSDSEQLGSSLSQPNTPKYIGVLIEAPCGDNSISNSDISIMEEKKPSKSKLLYELNDNQFEIQTKSFSNSKKNCIKSPLVTQKSQFVNNELLKSGDDDLKDLVTQIQQGILIFFQVLLILLLKKFGHVLVPAGSSTSTGFGHLINDNSFFLDGDQMVPSIYSGDISMFDEEQKMDMSDIDIEMNIPQQPDKTQNIQQLYRTQGKQNKDFVGSLTEIDFEKIKKAPIKQQLTNNYYITNFIKSMTTPLQHDNISKLYRQHFQHSFQALQYSRLLPIVTNAEIEKRMVDLGAQNKRKNTIVFDLDETLIHCNESVYIKGDIIISIQLRPDQDPIKASINIRPYAKECLIQLKKHFELVVFTASQGVYANQVINYLDPDSSLISTRVFRENCVNLNNAFIKDLRIFEPSRDLKNVVLIDNSCLSFAKQITNGIPILPFYNDQTDDELVTLTKFLISIKDIDDFRPFLTDYFKLDLYQHFNNTAQLYQNLHQLWQQQLKN